MVIRRSQFEALSNRAAAAFEQEMTDHLFDFAPKHCQVIKDTGVREVIRLGKQRAATYGFTNRGPVRLYLELMFMFGSEFATDPQHQWVAPCLEETMPGDQMYRAELLYDAAQKYLAQVSGPNHRYAAASLRRTREEISRASATPMTIAPAELRPALKSALRRTYPEKSLYLADTGLEQVINLGISDAEKIGVRDLRGIALFTFLVFALGHGVCDDPLFPWIRAVLSDPLLGTPEDRAARLESKAVVYLDHVIEYVRDM